MREIIEAGLEELGLLHRVPANTPEQLAHYGRLLLEKNQVMNLTAIREEAGVARLHMLDSAALLQYMDFAGEGSLIDVGTGAGFPGLALKILAPGLKVTLLDSLEKRLHWLEEVAHTLELDAVTTVHARAEELALEGDYRDSFDFATARAVAALPLLCELCLPFVRPGGRFFAMKSTASDGELEEAAPAIALLGGALEGCYNYTIPGEGITHRVVAIRKLAPTPDGYPRRWAKIKKEPLSAPRAAGNPR